MVRNLLSVLSVAMLLPTVALAEGSDDLPEIQELLPETVVHVDILAEGEQIVYEGEWPADLFDPAGVYVTTLVSPQTWVADTTGAWSMQFGTPGPRISHHWDVEVPGRTGGRVWSYDWRFNADTFRQRGALDRSFFVLLDGGAPGRDGVIEFQSEGFAGYVFRIASTHTGLPGAHGRSVTDVGQLYEPESPIYFDPPQKALHNPLTPTITSLTVDALYGSCQTVVPDVNSAEIHFLSDVSGTWHLICDLDGDGVYNMVDDNDLHKIGSAEPGDNVIPWNGKVNDGTIAVPGTYSCIIKLTVGESHFVGYDVETIYPGMRFFEYVGDGSRVGVSMFWNDIEVQANDISMPIGVPGPVSPGASGMWPGVYSDGTDPLGNARAWGNFRKGSKGDEAWLDTYGWLREADSAAFQISVSDGLADTDGDCLLDVEETCRLGTDPTLPDTDADGLSDHREVRELPTDPLNPDSDGDCLLDGEEAPPVGPSGPAPNPLGYCPRDPEWVDIEPGTGGPIAPNEDAADELAAGEPWTMNAMDPDDDNDGIPTIDEMCNLNPGENRDQDDDGRPNHLDRDSDSDTYSDSMEGQGDRDTDLIRDFLDRDSIGLGDLISSFYAGGVPQCGASYTPGVAGPLGVMLALMLRRRRR